MCAVCGVRGGRHIKFPAGSACTHWYCVGCTRKLIMPSMPPAVFVAGDHKCPLCRRGILLP